MLGKLVCGGLCALCCLAGMVCLAFWLLAAPPL